MRLRYQSFCLLIIILPFTLACVLGSRLVSDSNSTPAPSISEPTQNNVQNSKPDIVATPLNSLFTAVPFIEEQIGPPAITLENFPYLQQIDLVIPVAAHKILFSPDGSKIAAFYRDDNSGGKTKVTIFNYPSGVMLVEKDITIVRTPDGDDWIAVFSPDGNHLIYQDVNRDSVDPQDVTTIIQDWNLLDGSMRVIRTRSGISPVFVGITYSPSGELVILPDDIPSLRPNKSEWVDLLNYVDNSAWSPDGNGLVLSFSLAKLYYWDRVNDKNSRWLLNDSGGNVKYPLDIAFQVTRNRWIGIFEEYSSNGKTRQILDLMTGDEIGQYPSRLANDFHNITFLLDGDVIAVNNGTFLLDNTGKQLGSIAEDPWSIQIPSNRQVLAVSKSTGIQFFQIKLPKQVDVEVLTPKDGSVVENLYPEFHFRIRGIPEGSSISVQQEPYDFRLPHPYVGSGKDEFTIDTESNFTPGQTYTWTVHINAKVGEGQWEDWVANGNWSFTTPSDGVIPPAPNLLYPAEGQLVALKDGEVTLIWEEVHGALDYNLYHTSPNSSSGGMHGYIGIKSNEASVKLESGMVCEWYVIARTKYAYSSEPIHIKFTVE